MREAVKTLSRTFITHTINLFYPPSCPVCTAAIAAPHGLCASCWSKISLIEQPFCERLGLPFSVAYEGERLSIEAMQDPPVFRRARAVALYDDMARTLVQRLKYGDRQEIAPLMAKMMLRAGAELLEAADIIIPVPLHRLRLWNRKFNQAALLGQMTAAQSHRKIATDILERVKSTPSQVGLTRHQRRENLQGAFKVSPAKRYLLKDKNVLLIDDVMTTGATANAAARQLIKNGAEAVDVLTFARVPARDL